MAMRRPARNTASKAKTPAPADVETACGALGLEIRKVDEYEVHCVCPMHMKLTGKEDRNPSFSVNRSTGLMGCFGAETLVATWNGVRPIKELVGTVQRVLTPAGWVDAPFYSYGQQRLFNVVLSRNGVQKMIRATGNHRWMIDVSQRGGGRRRKEILTEDLLPNQRCSTVVPRRSGTLKPSRWGAAHGAVFGDGSIYPWGSNIRLYGEKSELLYLFEPCNVSAPVTANPGEVPYIYIDGLPKMWKQLPSIEESPSYLYGWLAGYFAADGNVHAGGSPRLTSARREHLEFVQTACLRMGVVTYGITEQWRVGKGEESTPLYSLTFERTTLSESFFLREHHRKAWLSSSAKFSRVGWVVVSVTPTDDVEEVYCAEVPEHAVFALDDQILTGNCWSCGYGGTFQKLVIDMKYPNDAFRASRWIRQFGVNLQGKVETLVTWENRRAEPVEEELDLDIAGLYASYTDPPLKQLALRRISLEAARHYGIRWEPRKRAWITPIRSGEGALLGWQIKSADGRFFRNFPHGVPKGRCLFGLDRFPAAEPAIVVESPLDVARLYAAGYEGGLATFGSKYTDAQMRLVTEHTDQLIAAFDNDEAGEQAHRVLLHGDRKSGRKPWRGKINLWFLNYNGISAKDVGAMADDEIAWSIEHALHWSKVATAGIR